jgi:hypothetical protein
VIAGARWVMAAACATLLAIPAAAQSAGESPRANAPWPIKVREHVDLWLHGYALLLDDTAAVPLFRRGYRDSLIVERNRVQRTSRLDTERDTLQRGLRRTASLFGGQFLAMHYAAFDPLRSAVQALASGGSDPRRLPAEARIAAAYFQSMPERVWAGVFANALGDESQTFHHTSWVAAQRAREPVLARADSLWRTLWFPRLRPFIRGSGMRAGEIIASLVVEGEGRTLTADPQAGPSLVVGLPASPADVNHFLYAVVHELSGALAQEAVTDNITPRQGRAGVGARMLTPAVLHAGMMVLQRAMPEQVDGYARFYLQLTGKPVPAAGVHASGALAAAFPLPADVVSTMKDRLDVVFGGL